MAERVRATADDVAAVKEGLREFARDLSPGGRRVLAGLLALAAHGAESARSGEAFRGQRMPGEEPDALARFLEHLLSEAVSDGEVEPARPARPHGPYDA